MISLCITAKDEEGCIANPIKQLRPFVSEILVVNDSSVDSTEKISLQAGADRVILLPFSIGNEGFDACVNWKIQQATQEWILLLDADELLDSPEHLQSLTRYPDINSWCLPRRKWNKYPITRMEYESFPDWQPKFFRRIPENRFIGKLHVRFLGKPKYSYRGPVIEHLHLENRTPEKIKQRQVLYEKLGQLQNVNVHGGELRENE